MNRYRIKISDHAAADLKALRDYISQTFQEPELGRKKVERIRDELKTLEVFPKRNALLQSQPEKEMGMRKMPVENHCIFYTVDEDTVHIVRIIYSGSDLLARLRSGR